MATLKALMPKAIPACLGLALGSLMVFLLAGPAQTPSDALPPVAPPPSPTATPPPTYEPPSPAPTLTPKPKPKPTIPPKPPCGEFKRAKLLKPQRQWRCVELPPVAGPVETVRMVSSNIKTSMGPQQFQADYRRIIAARPDFIALQEVSRRSDSELAIEGYSIYRSPADPFTRETPVLWDSTRWELLETGTRYLTTRKVKWGVRAVNWATVESRTTGRVVTILSAHPAPTIRVTEGLLPIFMARLTDLARELNTKGPVLMGGDYNVHYRGKLYHSLPWAQGELVSTWDQRGKLPTGDRGATIDYIFEWKREDLKFLQGANWLQESDHHALWGEWELSSPFSVPPRRIDSLVLSPSQGVLPPAFSGKP